MPRRLPNPLKPLLPQHAIARRVSILARQIEKTIDPAERPIAIVVLQGAFVFAADLLRSFSSSYPLEVAFLRCQSYGAEMKSSGRVLLLQDVDPGLDLHGRTVLLIDDILDTGLTIRFLQNHLQHRGASRVRVCVLLQRRVPHGTSQLKPDFVGFQIGQEFVVGYGLDYAGLYRHLPGLAAVDTKLLKPKASESSSRARKRTAGRKTART